MDKKGVNTSHVTVHLISMRYKFIITNSVNTSHITVHLKNKEKAENEAKRCQYIPCYCSSEIVKQYLLNLILCQYIPCYCSSC